MPQTSQSMQILDLFDDVKSFLNKKIPKFSVVKFDNKDKLRIVAIMFTALLLKIIHKFKLSRLGNTSM
jgi:hypothetical protein